jgi:3-polyprenyl-4-hydroxybenzoate decarboxylase
MAAETTLQQEPLEKLATKTKAKTEKRLNNTSNVTTRCNLYDSYDSCQNWNNTRASLCPPSVITHMSTLNHFIQTYDLERVAQYSISESNSIVLGVRMSPSMFEKFQLWQQQQLRKQNEREKMNDRMKRENEISDSKGNRQ